MKCIITSPPYNIKNSTGHGLTHPGSKRWPQNDLYKGYDEHDDNMPHAEYVEWQVHCLREMMRVLRNDGCIFYNHKWRVQGGILQDRHDIVKHFPVRQIIIWNRKGGTNWNDGYFLPMYEVIYLICKPGFKINKGAVKYGDVWTILPEVGADHPAPFPLEIAKRCILSASNEGDIVGDFFTGSGTVPVVAKILNRNFIACDKSKKYCEQSNDRIKHPFLL